MRGCTGIALAILLACAATARAEPAPDPNPEALQLMALNLYHEAGGEGRLGMLAVGWVVLNRQAHPAFPSTVTGVITQGCQFGWTCDDRPDEPTHRRRWQHALELARLLLTDPPADPTRGGMWFHHATNESPGWGSRIAPSTRIGNHLFYALTARLPKPRRKPAHALQVAQR